MVLHEQPLECARELAGGFEAVARILSERLHHDVLEVDWIARNERARARNVALFDLRESLAIGRHSEQAASRRELPQDDAEREDVGPAIEALAVQLLGRHVRELAFERS